MFTYSTYQYYTTAQHYRDNNMRSKIAWLPHVLTYNKKQPTLLGQYTEKKRRIRVN